MKVLKKVVYTTNNDDTEFIDYFEFDSKTLCKGKKIFEYLSERNLNEIISLETITYTKEVNFVEKNNLSIVILKLDETYLNSKMILDYLEKNYNLDYIISIETKMAVI